MSWACPCGCALRLTSEDEAKERLLIARLGPTPRPADMRVGQAPPRRRAEASEPVERGRCRSCGAQMELLAYLAESLRLRGAEWPFCDDCMRGRQTAFGGSF
jgi:hypothetical protein